MSLKFWKRGIKFPGKKCCPKWLKIVLWALFAVIILTAITCVVLQKTGYVDVIKMAYKIKQQQQISAEDRAILEQLGKIILLPKDIMPTMAVVTDVEALKKVQPGFFNNAKNGDRLIIYPDKAILFDVAANKIIQVGPVQFTQTSSLSFAIYNGTNDANAVTNYEKKVLNAVKNAQIISRGNAVGVYNETMIIDVSGKNKDIFQDLANSLNAKISGPPLNEKAPEGVDFLIIVGSNG
ncbi:hypothetical protein JW977_00735 [Candidatus Falkowbacteria bacterium]|nr:hypothetical protein [Candidatus Falkowbacteria bacterium]